MPVAQRRLITNAEYAKLTPQQRVALGLDEDEGGASADFSGTVLPNPNHLRPYADTESGIEPTRLSDGASFRRDLATGDMPRDVSNPPAAQLLPSEMQTVGAKMSAAPSTLPANFTGWDAPKAPPATLPKDFSQWDAPKSTQSQPESAGSRFGNSLLSGVGVVSPEQGKNFFVHPLDTLKAMADTQGELGIRAKNELANKDYVRGLTHAAEYLMPGFGPTLAKSGDQLESGDYAGGAGTMVGAALPIVAGSPEARATAGATADAISQHPAFIKASNAIKKTATAPVRLAARTTEAAINQKIAPVRPILNINTPADEAAAIQLKVPGRDFGLPKTPAAASIYRDATRQNAPFAGEEEATPTAPTYRDATKQNEAFAGEEAAGAPVERDATRQNVPYAGELDQMSNKLAQQLAEQKNQPAPTSADHLEAASVLNDALKSSTDDVVDSAIKPGGENHGPNLQTKSQVDFHLQRGDVGGAEQALDAAIKEHAPEYADMFSQRDGKVPSVMEIRQKVQSEPGSLQDRMETKGIQEAMRDNLQQHQWSAESEARREFIARNTTGWTKTWQTQAQRDAAHATAMASGNGDLTDVLQQSVQDALKKKGQQRTRLPRNQGRLCRMAHLLRT